MPILTEFMSKDHKACDDKFALAEQQVYAGKWGEANSAFKDFLAAMTHHFHIEEKILFPALLSHGGPDGPVQMMTMEHKQMSGLLDQMAILLAQKDAHSYGGLSETLLIVMQQHNMKEEHILYPLAERLLHENWNMLHREIEAIQ
jgi:hemerythrin-like domain-containing protein